MFVDEQIGACHFIALVKAMLQVMHTGRHQASWRQHATLQVASACTTSHQQCVSMQSSRIRACTLGKSTARRPTSPASKLTLSSCRVLKACGHIHGLTYGGLVHIWS